MKKKNLLFDSTGHLCEDKKRHFLVATGSKPIESNYSVWVGVLVQGLSQKENVILRRRNLQGL